jgi:phage terminase large subunit GpA-like protein
MTHYVHTLLFLCPECDALATTSEVRPEKNPENAEAKAYRILCDHCNNTHEVLGVMAKAHWVNEWSEARSAAAGG